MSNGTLSTAAGVRRYMRAIGSKSARRSTPVLVYEGARGYALGAHVAEGASVYAGDTATAHAAARGLLGAHVSTRYYRRAASWPSWYGRPIS
jgi:hypothetical protein